MGKFYHCLQIVYSPAWTWAVIRAEILVATTGQGSTEFAVWLACSPPLRRLSGWVYRWGNKSSATTVVPAITCLKVKATELSCMLSLKFAYTCTILKIHSFDISMLRSGADYNKILCTYTCKQAANWNYVHIHTDTNWPVAHQMVQFLFMQLLKSNSKNVVSSVN